MGPEQDDDFNYDAATPGGFNDDAAPAAFRVPTMPGHQVMELDQWEGEEDGPLKGSGGRPDLQSLLARAKDMLLAPTPDQPQTSSDNSEFFRWLGGCCSAPPPSCRSPGGPAAAAGGQLFSSDSSSDSLGLLECDNDGVYDEGVPDVSSRARKGKEAALEFRAGRESDKRKAVAAAASDGSASPPSSKREKASRYERKRRDRINQRMKTLGKLVPNTRKNDNKECLLDKAIEHIKQLQAHSQMMKSSMGGGAGGGGGVPYMLVPQPTAFPMVGVMGGGQLGVPGPMLSPSPYASFPGCFPAAGSAGGGHFSPAFQEQMAAMDMEEYHRTMASIYHQQRIRGGGGGWSENDNSNQPPQ